MMKKALTVVMCLAAVALLSFVTACGNAESPFGDKTVFTVRVDGGTGSGDYFEGDICQITADVPEGKQFMYWQSGDERISSSEEYMFTVTADIVISAVFSDAVEDVYKNSYTINVPKFSFINGMLEIDGCVSGEGEYLEGSSCTVKLIGSFADKESFLGWKAADGDGNPTGNYVSLARSYTFEIYEDITLVPVFDQGYTRMTTPGKETARFQSPYLEFNRETGDKAVNYTDPALDYVKISVYGNADKSGGALGWFKLLINPENTAELYVLYSDDSLAFECVGGFGNTFRNDTSNTAHFEFFSRVLGKNYVPGNTYYLASQKIAKPGSEVTVDGILCELGDSLESETNDAYYYTAT